MGLEAREDEILRMQDKFENLMDLNSLGDCHSMMAIMLRHADEWRETMTTLHTTNTTLARAVLAGDEDEARRLAKGILSGKGDSVVDGSLDIVASMRHVEGLTDEQLAEEAVGSVMSIPGFAARSAAVEELAKRFLSLIDGSRADGDNDGANDPECDKEQDGKDNGSSGE